MNLNMCALCHKCIQKNCNIHRAFDNTYCSRVCLNKKCKLMDSIDPGYKMPSKWQDIHHEYHIDMPTDSNKVINPVLKKYIDVDFTKLSTMQYAYLIASTFGILGIKKVLNNDYNTSLFI